MTQAGEADKALRAAVGKAAAPLAAMGITSVPDLLYHFPRRYLHFGEFTPLRQLQVGADSTVMAQVAGVNTRRAHNSPLTITTVTITDGHQYAEVSFFGRGKGMDYKVRKDLPVGAMVMVSGQVKSYRSTMSFTGATYRVLSESGEMPSDPEALERIRRPLPVYPASAKVTTHKIEEAVRLVVDGLRPEDIGDPVPEEVVRARRLLPLHEAIRKIHLPGDEADWKAARRRLRYDEAFLLQTAMARRRADIAARDAVGRPGVTGGLVDALDGQLPFELTAGQREVAAQISADLAADHPMQRLLQGEVGSGKTVVALRAMLQVIDSGGQAALLAPTEVLAQQHARSLSALLGPLAEAGMLGGATGGTRIALLTGSLNAAQRRQALADAASGAAGIVIGTHALLQERVQFADLGLTVIDEQHRFGVEQRDALRAKGRTMPHQLFMTATPIPRSVAMTVFGDVEVSTLSEIPAGRSPITTHLVPADNERWLQRTWAKVAEEVDRGNRAYVVAPRISSTTGEENAELIADDDGRPPASVEDTAEQLRAEPVLAEVPLAVLHGRLPAEEKDAVMAAFAQGATPLLVTTTVVEVGVDVPQATVMVILDADRFGLSQLHQLRGRIGRGSEPGLCLLVSAAPPGSPAHDRLQVIAGTTDGFVLAEADLAARREGDVLGAAQSGRAHSLRLLRVIADRDLIADAREDARALIAQDPNLALHPELLVAVARLVDPDHEEFLDRA